ncbi:MAG: hypothetical protein GWP15_03360, partial [Nitrospirae bacterium]|nr:hypothetical protein [Nitrospirota bacterium]
LQKMDLDNDGMSDAYAMSKGIPLFNSDPDGDGISTMDEIFCGWDPVDADLLSDNLDSTKVTNLKGMTTGNVPVFRACGEEGSVVDVVLFDMEDVLGDEKFASEEELIERLVEGIGSVQQNYVGSIVMDEANQGVMFPLEALEDGKYIMMLSDEDGIEHISTLSVENDKVPAPAEIEIGSKGLELGFVTENTLYLTERFISGFDVESYIGLFSEASIPMVYGQIEDFESLTVVATWNSRILSSTVLADATEGSFELAIPDDLPPGAHEIIIYLQDENEDLVSSAVVLPFIK